MRFVGIFIVLIASLVTVIIVAVAHAPWWGVVAVALLVPFTGYVPVLVIEGRGAAQRSLSSTWTAVAAIAPMAAWAALLPVLIATGAGPHHTGTLWLSSTVIALMVVLTTARLQRTLRQAGRRDSLGR